MKPLSFPTLAAVLALALAAAPASAQFVQALPGTTDADRLAEQMRAVAADPKNVTALVTAGELSLKLDDLSAAASLFARADKVDARNPRVKAGMGSILVRSERPGEALRYFQQAEQLGLPARQFAADRGLAYDLIGQQARAQRDYRLALTNGSDDETARRYALSLGIAGQREQALAQLEPLLRKTDRGAWRARAFVLALTGDTAGAEKIAATMMPGGTAQGLAPFFQRLPTLAPADRAFAVHFGEIVATPDRIADARLVPALPPLAPEAAPVQVAAVAVQQPPQREDRRSRKRREQQERAQQQAATTAAPASTPTVLAAADTRVPTPITAAQARSAPATVQSVAPARSVAAPVVQQPLPQAVAPAVRFATPAAVVQPVSAPPVAAASTSPAPAPTIQRVTPVALPDRQVASVTPITRPPVRLATPATSAPVLLRQAPTRDRNDTVLARIIAGLTIPAAELVPARTAEAAPPPPVGASRRSRTAAAQHVVAEAEAKEARDAAAEKVLADKAATERTAADRRAADRKAVADRKALAAREVAKAKKLADAKEAAEEKKAARANPSRIWVQVAGGANEDDLPKAWTAAKGQAASLGGRQAYTTKLRATNRVLTGPFKTDAEARAFVNQLKKQGIGAFSFTSDAGQKVAKLPAK